MTIEIAPPVREYAIQSIKNYFSKNVVDTGAVAADELLQYFVDELGPIVFNPSGANVQAIQHPQPPVETKKQSDALQPLRVVHGWLISWNTLTELDPTEENVLAFRFTSSSLLVAVNTRMRLLVDVAWLPPDEPDGRFVVEVYYAPIEGATKGIRHKNMQQDEKINYYRDGRLVHTFEARDRETLVNHLESIVFNAKGIEHA